MTAIAIIPARAGSVRIPGKNKRLFHGKPIITYSIEAARASKLFAHVFVSTDDPDISLIAEAAGAIPLVRLSLVDAESGTQEVMGHVLRTQTDAWKPEYACCIYPTAPMMTAGDLIRGWNRMVVPRTVYTMSVGTDPLHDPGQWYFGLAKAFRDGLPLLDINTGMVPIPPERCCDINTEDDWYRAERMYQAWQESITKEAA
jgi:N-acylneuraminate cytidylyltransferase